MKAATHQGHCQVCGRIQALPGAGTLSLHGYVVAGFGFFNGVCQGARHRPLQQDRKITDSIILSLGEYADRCTARAKALQAGTETPEEARSGKYVKVLKTGKSGYRYQSSEHEMIPFAQADSYHQKIALDSAILSAQQAARQARSFAKDLGELADRIHGTKLIPVEAEKGAATAEPGTRVTISGDELELVEKTYVPARGWTRRDQPGWKVRRLSDGREWAEPNATITRALKKQG